MSLSGPRKPIPRRSPMKRGGKIAPKKRSASEFARIYGSRARVAWVKTLRCCVHTLGCIGPIDNAHTENGGMGRKADARTIVPLCNHLHRKLHAMGAESFQRVYRVELRAEAARVDALWQAVSR